jgi:hypothetical protein
MSVSPEVRKQAVDNILGSLVLGWTTASEHEQNAGSHYTSGGSASKAKLAEIGLKPRDLAALSVRAYDLAHATEGTE